MRCREKGTGRKVSWMQGAFPDYYSFLSLLFFFFYIKNVLSSWYLKKKYQNETIGARNKKERKADALTYSNIRQSFTKEGKRRGERRSKEGVNGGRKPCRVVQFYTVPQGSTHDEGSNTALAQ